MTHLAFIHPLLFAPGDRLTLEEFLEKWEQMPDLKFAELIDGTVYMPSPLSYEHGRLDALAHLALGFYAAKTRTCEQVVNATWLMQESAPQPDAALRQFAEFGGKTTVRDKLAAGAPELVFEITRTSRSYDLGPKLTLYQRAGVQEYVAAILDERRIEWRMLENGSYVLQRPDDRGIYRSRVFPGLWLDEPAFWAVDSARLVATLEEGLHSGGQ